MADEFRCGAEPTDQDLRVVAAFRDFLNGDRPTPSPDPRDGLLTVVRNGRVVHARTLQLGLQVDAEPGDPRYEDARRHETVRRLLRENGVSVGVLAYLFHWNSAVGAGYHNTQHLYTVAINAATGAWVEHAPTEDRVPLLLAGLFHDIDHTLDSSDDQVNIDRAIAAFDHATTTVLRDVDEATAARTRQLIQGTLFPHVQPTSIAEAIIMDADLMQTLEPDSERWVAGLREERGGRLTDEDADAFIRDATFHTAWGRARQARFLAKEA